MARLVLHVAQVSSLVKMNGDNTFSPILVQVRSSKIGRCVVDVVVAFVVHSTYFALHISFKLTGVNFLQCEFYRKSLSARVSSRKGHS
jgi:hypothetical protein